MAENCVSPLIPSPPRPHILQPGVLSYDAWIEKTDHFLYGMLDYLDRVIETNSHSSRCSNYVFSINKKELFTAFLKYVYRTSINRFKAYEIVE